jgi:hypothetical protein
MYPDGIYSTEEVRIVDQLETRSASWFFLCIYFVFPIPALYRFTILVFIHQHPSAEYGLRETPSNMAENNM